jgi:hypothetical protein
MVDLLLGLVANTARVVKDMGCFVGRIHLTKALLEHGADDLFRIVGIHLATERFEIKSFFHYASILRPAAATGPAAMEVEAAGERRCYHSGERRCYHSGERRCYH